MSYDVIVFIKCSGPNVREDNLNDTIKSFVSKNKTCNYAFYVTVDPHMLDAAKNVLGDFPDRLLDLKVSENSWAKDFNTFFEEYKDESDWILISHDDVEYITEDYFNSIIDQIKGHEDKIGWITSTSDYYYADEGQLVTDTFRAGYHNDVDNWGAMFQLHNMTSLRGAPPHIIRDNLHLLDYPDKPVKVHGVMSAVMLVSSKSLKKIGHCEDWTNYTMLIDEDWSLEALKNNLWNVWIPDVFHKHPLRRSSRPTNNKWENEAHAGFTEKWGYDTGSYSNGLSISVDQLREKYKDTNIPWSTYRNSYDWEYLDV
jgi:hypothetical protein